MFTLNPQFKESETLLVMALPSESQKLFEKEGIPVNYTGLGKVNAAFHTTRCLLLPPEEGAKLRNIKQVLNLGTAGSDSLSMGQIVECVEFVQRDMNLTPLGVPLGKTPLDKTPVRLKSQSISNYPAVICGTGDSVEVSRTDGELNYEVMDMEAFAIAKVCYHLNIPFYSFKYITDGSNKNTLDDWNKNLRSASEALLKVYLQAVER